MRETNLGKTVLNQGLLNQGLIGISYCIFFFASGRDALESSSKEMECVKQNRKRESVH